MRNKDHDLMMSYLKDTNYNLHAWNYHAGRAAKYIEKLEAEIAQWKKRVDVGEIGKVLKEKSWKTKNDHNENLYILSLLEEEGVKRVAQAIANKLRGGSDNKEE